MTKNAHLTFDERLTIEIALRARLGFKDIAKRIDKDPSTVSKEIRNHYKVVEKSSFNPCVHIMTCTKSKDACKQCTMTAYRYCKQCKIACYSECTSFERQECSKLSKPPYVCNGCTNRTKCKLSRHVYDAKFAQNEYETVRSESRQGFAINSEELERIDKLISPLIKRGQSIHQICVNNADLIMLDEKTIYNYIDAGLLSARNIDLPRKVRYRVRKKKKTVRIDKKCHLGRTYEDFKAYINENPDTSIVEMDTVEGRKGGKVLLTMYFRSCSLMLAFIREHNTARSVTEIFNSLYNTLGHEHFARLFPVILTDRGSEFTDPVSLELNECGERRTRIYYCNPQRSDQKGGCEVTHEMIRRIIPKKVSFDNLLQSDISLMMSHINSYKRKKLNDRSAYQVFSFIHNEDILALLDIQSVPASEINLTPSLLKK